MGGRSIVDGPKSPRGFGPRRPTQSGTGRPRSNREEIRAKLQQLAAEKNFR